MATPPAPSVVATPTSGTQESVEGCGCAVTTYASGGKVVTAIICDAHRGQMAVVLLPRTRWGRLEGLEWQADQEAGRDRGATESATVADRGREGVATTNRTTWAQAVLAAEWDIWRRENELAVDYTQEEEARLGDGRVGHGRAEEWVGRVAAIDRVLARALEWQADQEARG